MLETGTASLAIALKTEVMDRIALPLASLGPEDVLLIGAPGAQIKSVSDLHGKVVAQLRYSDYYPEIIADTQIQKYSTTNYEVSLKMLLSGRVDAVVGLRTGLSFAMHRLGFRQEQLGSALILRTGEPWVYLSKKFTDKPTIELLEQSAQHIAGSGFFDEVRMKYGAGKITAANKSAKAR